MKLFEDLRGVFAHPMFLTLLALLPLIWWRWWRPGKHSTVRFSSLGHLRRRSGTRKVRLRVLLPLLRTSAVAVLILCLARPQKGDEETRVFSEGVAIQLLVDRSSSMLAEDFMLEGGRVNRLEAIKAVATEFVVGNEAKELRGRPDDLIGMITFAGYADSKCPLTLDHAYLIDTLSKTEIVDPSRFEDEDGTAIGDAIALGVLRMKDLTRRREALQANRLKSKIMVLLTDGEQTRGDLTPQQGAELAKAEGIKVYTIGVGTRGWAPVPTVNIFGQKGYDRMMVRIDEATLKQVAQITGGEYFRATDTDSLTKIYSRIDELEKTETEEKRYLQHLELATQALTIDAEALPWLLNRLPAKLRTIPPLLIVVIALLALEIVLGNTLLRKIP